MDEIVPNNTLIADNAEKESRLFNSLIYSFRRECTSCAKYGFFAQQAKSAGYEALSDFFFACSHSELVHSSRHAKVALFLGVKLDTEVVPREPLDVPEMVKEMLSEEEKAITLYPEYLRLAESENCPSVVLTINAALEGSNSHLKFLRELADSDDYWKGESKQFYVCALCGYIHEWSRISCPVCGAKAELFLPFPNAGHFDTETMFYSAPKRGEEAGDALDKNMWKCAEIFPNHLPAANEFITRVTGEMTRKGWSTRDVFAVNLALAEATVNAVEHGNGKYADKHIHIESTVTEDFFFCAVQDEGDGFAPEDVPDPNLAENRGRRSGRGLKLIQGFMSKIWFNPSGNKIYMMKHRS